MKEEFLQHIRFEYELGGRTGMRFNLYERAGERYICVEGQTGTKQIEGRTSHGNERLDVLYPVVAQMNRFALDTKEALRRAIQEFVRLHNPTSFTFVASQLGNPEKGERFAGKAKIVFPESLLKANLENLSFDQL